MKWPWVSRELANMTERRRASETDALQIERRRYDALLDKYHELAATKGTPILSPPSIIPALADVPERVPSVIAQAIKDEAGGDPKLSRYLWARARELRAENMKPEEIASELRKWLTTEVTE